MPHKSIQLLLLIILSLGLTSCMKDNEDKFYLPDFRIEFQDAVINNNAPGLNYPELKALKSGAGLQEYQINLLGGQMDKELPVSIKVLGELSTAVEGIHYHLPEGLKTSIPANSSFGYLLLDIPELEEKGEVIVVFELQSTEAVHANAHYRRIGVKIKK